jgi:hypothetical protein
MDCMPPDTGGVNGRLIMAGVKLVSSFFEVVLSEDEWNYLLSLCREFEWQPEGTITVEQLHADWPNEARQEAPPKDWRVNDYSPTYRVVLVEEAKRLAEALTRAIEQVPDEFESRSAATENPGLLPLEYFAGRRGRLGQLLEIISWGPFFIAPADDMLLMPIIFGVPLENELRAN